MTSDEIVAALAPPAGPVTEQVTILNPENVDPKVLESRNFVLVRLQLSDPGTERDETLCTKTSAGWNDCVLVSNWDNTNLMEIGSYVADDGVLEVWLLDSGARLTEPIRLLGTLELEELRRPEVGIEYVTAIEVDLEKPDALTAIDGYVESERDGAKVESSFVAQIRNSE